MTGRAALLFLFAAVILGSRLPPVLDDPDLWWHLATGRWILEEGRLPWTDPFSHTALGLPWLAYSWLTDLLFVSLERSVGLVAFPWMVAIACAATHLLAVGAAWTRTRRFVPSLVAALLCFLVTYPYWNERPQIFSFLFLACLGWGLEELRKGDRTPLFWIPGLFAVWANVHIYFPLGWFFLGVHGLDAVYRNGLRRGTPWIVLFCCSVLATLCNPYRLRLHSYLAALLLRWDAVAISEEMGPLWSRPDVAVAVAVFSVVFLMAVRRTRRRLEAWCLFAPLFLLSLTQLKLVPFLVLSASGALAEGLSRSPRLKSEGGAVLDGGSTNARSGLRLLFCFFGLAWILLRAPNEESVRLALQRANLPRKACQVLAFELPTGTLFNPIDEGGYLVYRLYPRWRVFVDPRNHLFALVDDFHEQYIRHANRPSKDALEWVEGFGVDTALVGRDTAWHSVFAASHDWSVVHEDATHLVLRKGNGLLYGQGEVERGPSS